MKKKILSAVGSLLVLGSMTAFAEREATLNAECNNIYISGQVSEDIKCNHNDEKR